VQLVRVDAALELDGATDGLLALRVALALFSALPAGAAGFCWAMSSGPNSYTFLART